MKIVRFTIAAAAGVALAGAASAQTIGIGATKGGAVAQITAAISKAVSSHAPGIQMRRQTMGGTQQYIPVVNAGELEFGISNIAQYYMAITGTGLSAGNKYDDLRLVTNMMTFNVGIVVAEKSGIKSLSDLRGKRIACGFKAAPLFTNIHDGSLATVGLTPKDIECVPAVGLRQHWNMFMEGKLDGVVAAVGSGSVKQMNAKISGGIRYLSYPNNPEALKDMHKHFPKTFWQTVQPSKRLTGIMGPTTAVSYDYMLWTNKGVKDETVYAVTKVMHDHIEELKKSSPLWRSYTVKNMAKQHGLDYHPGAVKFYTEKGLWKTGS